MPHKESKISCFSEMSLNDFNRLSNFISSNYGIKMPVEKKIMLECRLQKRMRHLKFSSYHDYCNFIFSKQGLVDEMHNMIDVVSTNKTDFFREQKHFNYLNKNILPAFIGLKSSPKMLNLLSAGCSSGEEAYSLAMILNEFKERNPDFDFSILGTDISNIVLNEAKNAIYSANKVEIIPYNLKKKYLLKSKDKTLKKVRIIPEIRAKVKFQRLNLNEDNYNIIKTFDIIFCRNTLIYFDHIVQYKVISKLCQILKTGGYLIIGHSETLFNMKLPLTQVSPTIFKKYEK